jgi:hypothetical protein
VSFLESGLTVKTKVKPDSRKDTFLDKADEGIGDAMDYFFQSIGWDWSPPIEETSLTISVD